MGFKDSMDAEDIGGGLAEEFKGDASDMKAFLGISKSLFGLQIKLLTPKTGDWDEQGPLPVFYNPVLDESVTEWIHGFNPDGSQVAIRSRKDLPYPFLYLCYDERFFEKPENLSISQEGEVAFLEEGRPYDLRNPFKLNLIARAYANRPNGHESFYDEYEMKIFGFWYKDNYEPFYQSLPEFYTKTWLRFKYIWIQ